MNRELDQFILALLAELDELHNRVSGFEQMETVVFGVIRAVEKAQAKIENP